MSPASVASIRLARFGSLREAGSLSLDGVPGLRFLAVGTDTRAAGTEPGSQLGFTFMVLGLHADVAAARTLMQDLPRAAPWLQEADESWSAVLQPFRHHGAANYLDENQPGPLFGPMPPPTSEHACIVVITTVGWLRDGLDMARVREFGAGVMAVRMSMTGVPGLYTQHSFFFPGVLALDPVTVTIWHDEASVRDFAYGQGSHRRQLDRLRSDHLADRTSFTRCDVVDSAGTWHGRNPAARGSRG